MKNKELIENELTKKILQPVSNEEFNRYVKDMGVLFEQANKLSEHTVIERTVNPETFADRLCNAIKERQFTQIKLAKLSGLSAQTISYYCNGERLPNTDILKQLATALNVSADYLLGIESESVKTTQEMLIKQAQNELLDKIIEFCTELKK